MIKNAKTLPKVYYGLHMAPGVAEYRDKATNNGEPYRIFVDEPVIKNMDTTFAGKPLFVLHAEQINLETLQEDADGYVVESFYNKFDGKHWAKFIVVSDKGHEAIAKGWKLSNAYVPKRFSGGGLWHGVEYLKEVVEAEYEHLAIVPNPRYEESVILTPEDFKAYNDKKEMELKKLTNSKEKKEGGSMFSFFKKTKLENSADFDGATVVLPKSKVELSLSAVINMADEMEMAKNEEKPMCNIEHYVSCGGKDMKVSELVNKYMSMIEEKAKNEEKKPEDKKEENTESKDDAAKAENMDKGEEKKAEEMPEKKQNSKHFETLVNAPDKALEGSTTLDLSIDKLARGKQRYGSN